MEIQPTTQFLIYDFYVQIVTHKLLRLQEGMLEQRFETGLQKKSS